MCLIFNLWYNGLKKSSVEKFVEVIKFSSKSAITSILNVLKNSSILF